VPIANVGRGEYNDLVIADPSVSTMHAKLQARDGIWIVADLGSTNGTFVDGQLIDGEVPLGPGSTIRFGEIATMFEPLDDGEAEPLAATAVMPRLETESVTTPPAAELVQPALRRRPRPRPAPPPANRTPLLVLLALLVVALVLAAFLMLKR